MANSSEEIHVPCGMKVIERNSDNVNEEKLMTLLQNLLKNNETEKAVQEIQLEKHEEYLRENVLNVIPIIFTLLVEQCELDLCCTLLLDHIAKVCKPKEVILSLLEQIEVSNCEDMNSIIRFKVAVQSLKSVHLKVFNRPECKLSYTLSVFESHIGFFNISEGDSASHISEIYYSIVDFLEPFVFQATEKNQVNLLTVFLIRLLGNPIVYLDVSCTADNKSLLRTCAEKIVCYLNMLTNNLCFVLNCVEVTLLSSQHHITKYITITSTQNVPCEAVAMLMYLIYVEEIHLDAIPQVYHPTYVFQIMLPLIICLLEKSPQEILSVHKGLLLIEQLLKRISCAVLDASVLDWPFHSSVTALLASISIYCTKNDYRRLAIHILDIYLSRFNPKGVYQILLELFNSVNHSGFFGYVVMKLKDEIAQNLRCGMPSKYFSGHYFHQLIRKVCHLEAGPQTDLLHCHDKVISVLNLLRFLFLRDISNVTGIWDLISELERNFLVPLQKGLEFSRNHYMVKLDDLKKNKSQTSSENNVEINIGGQPLPNLPFDSKKDVVLAALNTFDLIECILARVKECIQYREM